MVQRCSRSSVRFSRKAFTFLSVVYKKGVDDLERTLQDHMHSLSTNLHLPIIQHSHV